MNEDMVDLPHNNFPLYESIKAKFKITPKKITDLNEIFFINQRPFFNYIDSDQAKKFLKYYKYLQKLVFEIDSILPKQLPYLKTCQKNKKIILTRRAVALLFLLSFFNLINITNKNCNFFNVSLVLKCVSHSQFEFGKCFINYLTQIGRWLSNNDPILDETITYIRDNIDINNYQDKELCEINIYEKGSLFEGDASYCVDFANKYIGGGVLNQGCVQEEILFAVEPEAIVSLLFMEVMDKNDAIGIFNTIQYSKYKGYGSNFKFLENAITKDLSKIRRHKIIAIDAAPPKKQDNNSNNNTLNNSKVNSSDNNVCNTNTNKMNNNYNNMIMNNNNNYNMMMNNNYNMMMNNNYNNMIMNNNYNMMMNNNNNNYNMMMNNNYNNMMMKNNSNYNNMIMNNNNNYNLMNNNNNYNMMMNNNYNRMMMNNNNNYNMMMNNNYNNMLMNNNFNNMMINNNMVNNNYNNMMMNNNMQNNNFNNMMMNNNFNNMMMNNNYNNMMINNNSNNRMMNNSMLNNNYNNMMMNNNYNNRMMNNSMLNNNFNNMMMNNNFNNMMINNNSNNMMMKNNSNINNTLDNMNTKEKEDIKRDIHKAYVGFNLVNHDQINNVTKTIATGNWGCGAFGGNHQLKFIQQWIAASFAGIKRLDYYTFGHQKMEEAQKNYNIIKNTFKTANSLYYAILNLNIYDDNIIKNLLKS